MSSSSNSDANPSGSDVGQEPSYTPAPDSDAQRKKLVWESILGFVGFFTLLAGIQAVWNLFQDEPTIWRGLFFAVMLVMTWLVWRRYRRYTSY